jgi:hypothetical protein
MATSGVAMDWVDSMTSEEEQIGEALKAAAAKGLVKEVKLLAKKVKQFKKIQNIHGEMEPNVYIGMYFKASFEAAAHAGQIKVMQILYNYLDSPRYAIGALYEAARYGAYLAAQWILNRKIPFNETDLLTAARIASANQHWAVMQLCMIKGGFFIDGKTTKPSESDFIDGVYYPEEQRQYLVMHPLRAPQLQTTVYIPDGARVPAAIQGKQTIETKRESDRYLQRRGL